MEANFWRDANRVREIARASLFDRAERAVVLQFIAEAERLVAPGMPDVPARRSMRVAAREEGPAPTAD